MKVQAQELKVGMTFKKGNVWATVSQLPLEYTFKPSEVRVMAMQHAGIVKRSCGHKSIVDAYETDFYFRKTTMVELK